MKNHNLMIEIGRRVQYPQMLIDDVELITPLNYLKMKCMGSLSFEFLLTFSSRLGLQL